MGGNGPEVSSSPSGSKKKGQGAWYPVLQMTIYLQEGDLCTILGRPNHHALCDHTAWSCPTSSTDGLRWTVPAAGRRADSYSTPLGSGAGEACPEAVPWQVFMQQIPQLWSLQLTAHTQIGQVQRVCGIWKLTRELPPFIQPLLQPTYSMTLERGNRVRQDHWTRTLETWGLIPALLLPSRATLEDSFHVSGPQPFLLSNGLILPAISNTQR